MAHALLVGTYTEKLPHVDGQADGILSAKLDGSTVIEPTVAANVRNPSWLTTTADQTRVYCVVETVEFEDQPGGGVAAYARDPDTEALTLLNTASSAGTEPAHLELTPDERHLLVANYRTGSVAVFALGDDGRLGQMVHHVQHEGSSVHSVRQSGPHAHQILFDPVTGQVIVPDLGLDALLFYRIDGAGRLTERTEQRLVLPPGAGPRHLAFHPDGDHLFLLNELDNTLMVLGRSGDGFAIRDVQSTLPTDFTGHNQTSAVRVSASGAVVYAANRGFDSIAVFAFDPGKGTVELKAVEPSRGREPRDFIEAVNGELLLVANQDSDSIVSFAIDETVPSLTFVSSTPAPTPVCLRLVRGGS